MGLATPRIGFTGFVAALALWTAAGPAAAKNSSRASSMQLHVDASAAPQGRFHAKLTIHASPGALTLVYPKWLPGEHGPTGPINGMVGLTLQSGGSRLAWRRDEVDMYSFHCTVPRGADGVEVEFDYLAPVNAGRFTSGASTTEELALLNWNQVVLYPEGAKPNTLQVHPSLRLPSGWKYGTSLQAQGDAGGSVEFETVSLETLIDSPVLMGEHFRVVPLGAGDPGGVELHLACDGEEGLAIAPEFIVRYQRMVAEADALFGVRHFRRYRFLLTLSDHTAHFGLEHHESSDNRVAERSLIDPDLRNRMAGLLPHEYVHSWNGKYRRPDGLATVDYQQPMRGELLWVYEGLTQYLAWVLAARSGLRSPEMSRDMLADVAAYLDQRPGRTWRPLRDTAVAAQLVFAAPGEGEESRRAADFYNEGLLIWLDADVVIREQTGGQKSLDDFCKRFFAGPGGTPKVVAYRFEDLVADLRAVAPYDWAGFLNQRLDSTAPHAPLGGVVNGGWQLAFVDSVPKLQKSLEEANKSVDLRYSLGLRLEENGRVQDVVPGRAAAAAGISPGVTLVAVNGRKFKRKVVREAIRAAQKTGAPLDLLVLDGEFYVDHKLDYRDGERYPSLQRAGERPDVLSQILMPQGDGIATRGN